METQINNAINENLTMNDLVCVRLVRARIWLGEKQLECTLSDCAHDKRMLQFMAEFCFQVYVFHARLACTSLPPFGGSIIFKHNVKFSRLSSGCVLVTPMCWHCTKFFFRQNSLSPFIRRIGGRERSLHHQVAGNSTNCARETHILRCVNKLRSERISMKNTLNSLEKCEEKKK